MNAAKVARQSSTPLLASSHPRGITPRSGAKSPEVARGFRRPFGHEGFARIKDEFRVRGRGFRGIRVRVHFEPPPEES